MGKDVSAGVHRGMKKEKVEPVKDARVKKQFTIIRKKKAWSFQVLSEGQVIYESVPNIFLITLQNMKQSVVRYARGVK